MECDYVYQRGQFKGTICGSFNCAHRRRKMLVIYINYTSITPFIRFFDGKKIFNKKYTNVYNNSCTSIYLNKYHMLMPKFIMKECLLIFLFMLVNLLYKIIKIYNTLQHY